MNIPAEFDEIRPYTPEELPQIFDELTSDPAFRSVIQTFIPNVPLEILIKKLHQCKTNLDVQKAFFYDLLQDIVKKHSDGLDLDSSAIPDKTMNYTFISNHRDIVLDSGLLSIALLDNGYPTTVEIAIGDNLLIYPWIKKLVRINKSFIVQRALSMRQMLESSARMSRYMHFAISEKKENIWIAQREGRAKDSNDRTQDSVLKMLAMGGEGDIIDRLKELNIVPLSLSYEYDPCDYLKAQEMQQKRDIEGFKKTQMDDLNNMQTGIFGYKGRIHFHADQCINDELEKLRSLPKNEIFTSISNLIDKSIHTHYRLYPGNYVALDLLENTTRFTSQYTDEDKAKFIAYLNGRIDLIELENKDENFLSECILTMYANPVRNHLAAINL